MKAASWCKSGSPCATRPTVATSPSVKVATLVGNFRADFRLALIMTKVCRAAAMQLGSGLPSGSIRGSYGLTSLDLQGSASAGLE